MLWCNLGLVAALLLAAPAHQAWLLDLSEPEHGGEALLGVTLQGLVNRDAPRLFIRSHFWVNPASDDFWVRYLSEHKGFTFTRLDSLGAAVAHFAAEGRIKGLVVYDPARYSDSCVAATLAAQRDLLPVTPEMLAYRTPMLAGAAGWVEDPMTRAWADWFAQRRITAAGQVVTANRDPKDVPSAAGVQRWVRLDLAATPLLEIEVPAAAGQWGLMINVGTRDAEAPMVIPFNGATGVKRVDLRPLLAHGADRALIRICVKKQGDSVTVRRLRLLAADGAGPDRQPAVVACFQGLPVVEDLRGRFKTEDEAYAWAMKELLPACDRKLAFSAIPGWWNMMGADLAVARKAFIFHQDKKEIRRNYPLFDQVLQSLDPPAQLFGWGHSEWLMTWRVSEFGSGVECSGAPNLSFWRGVPTDGPFTLPHRETVSGPLQARNYVVFYTGDGDAPKTIAGVQNGDWTDPARGSVPLAWGIQPYLMALCPALLEYYAQAATPADSFFSGPSGAGYTYPITMPNLDQYVPYSRGLMAAAGVATLDEWDLVRLDTEKVHRRFTAPGPQPPVRCFLQAPMGLGQPAVNLWLDDGTPLVIAEDATPSTALWAVMPRDFDAADPLADVARRITAVADAHEPPYFIAVYSHMSPSFCRDVAARLDPRRFTIIGVPDLERLGRQASGLTASAAPAGVGPGGRVTVELALHNPDGDLGRPGAVTWTLPPGWTADAQRWEHGEVPARGVLRRTVVVTAPADLGRQPARLGFRDSRLDWERGLRIEAYPASQPVADPSSTAGWVGEAGATVSVADGLTRFRGPSRESRVGREVAIDFDRGPILEAVAGNQEGKWGLSLIDAAGKESWLLSDAPVIGDLTFDLVKLTGFSGRKTVRLAVHPAMSFGHSVALAGLALHYQK